MTRYYLSFTILLFMGFPSHSKALSVHQVTRAHTVNLKTKHHPLNARDRDRKRPILSLYVAKKDRIPPTGGSVSAQEEARQRKLATAIKRARYLALLPYDEK